MPSILTELGVALLTETGVPIVDGLVDLRDITMTASLVDSTWSAGLSASTWNAELVAV